MDKTKSRLAAFFDNDEEESSFPQKTVDDAKLSQYAAGRVRKSRKEKEQEAAEAKKREEEANAAKAYAEFIDAFEGEDVGRKKGGTSFVKASTESRDSACRALEHLLIRSSPSPPLNVAPKPKGKRAMDAFLEEIKKDQAEREAKYSRHAHGHGQSVTALAAYEGQSGSKDRGDPQTSNVFVANLPPHVTEQTLGNFFARVGPVGSVKVMWPRTDASIGPGADMTASRRTKSAGLSGFVSFMKRKDAERALREFDGFDWGGSILRVGWSKAVPVAAKPQYAKTRSWNQSRSQSPSRDRRHSLRQWNRTRSRSPQSRRSHSRSRRSRSPRKRHSRSPQSRGHMQEEEAVTDTFIRAVAAEGKLRERERNNPKFAFLLHRDHRRHAYYRGLVESQEPLQPEFDDDGYNSVYSTDSAEDSERERVRKTVLGRLARRRFESMLRALSGKRGEMARCMTFSLEHAEAAHEVVDIIVASLLVDGTPVPRKVARLHLICDILHNSAASVPSAWKFRLEFQITAETFKKQITAVVDIWEDWIVFPPDFTAELRLRLDGMMKEAPSMKSDTASEVAPKSEAASTFKLAAPEDGASSTHPEDEDEPMNVGSDVDGEPVDDVDGETIDDVDGEPVDDVDGMPLNDDIDGEPVHDIDGDPLDHNVDGTRVDDDVDGIPMDEDIDGEAIV
ncbi:hypothetical protein FPV67DRAFT_1561398 [Lyophyllum atratum]|nr:hypothetical protein FPV67DRAFT_1561398 [Lyophyllum atratum]